MSGTDILGGDGSTIHLAYGTMSGSLSCSSDKRKKF